MQTRAAVVTGPDADFEFVEVELSEPREDEVLVRMVATGVCHTDISVKSFLPAEMFPHIFGHEGAGIVMAVGADVSDIAVGDKVVLSYRSCRACAACTDGDVAYCESNLLLNYMGTRLDGSTTYTRAGQPVFGSFFGQSSFAEHVIAYADNCVVVDPDADLSRYAPYGCSFQTGAGTIFNVLDSQPEDAVVIFGAGAVGLAAVAGAAHSGVGQIIAVDPLPARRQAAASLGAKTFDPGAHDDVVAAIQSHLQAGATAAIDTTALPAVVAQAQRVVAARGTIVALGLGAAEYTLDAIDLLQSGKVVRSSVEGDSDPLTMVPQLIALNRAGSFPVDSLITTYPVEHINAAIADVNAGKVIKPVLLW